ncbi:MAG: pyruvate kinase [Bacilli bacterium]|nr:pyruvate kinase [Bacilli bacterium]MDD4388996.1 pyruvate kinase [Bacilli bacterium]
MKRKTKIVCTIGPAIDNDVMIEKIIKASMNVARLNFSHTNYKEHLVRIELIRKTANKLNQHIGIMADTKGPVIRTGIFEDGDVFFDKNDIVYVLKDEVSGNKERFYISYPGLFSDIKIGDYILIDDGKIRLDVLETYPDSLKCSVRNVGIIKSRKGINIPNVKLNIPFISKKDQEDIIFAANNDVDLIDSIICKMR